MEIPVALILYGTFILAVVILVISLVRNEEISSTLAWFRSFLPLPDPEQLANRLPSPPQLKAQCKYASRPHVI